MVLPVSFFTRFVTKKTTGFGFQGFWFGADPNQDYQQLRPEING